jgi:hypothetical protein
VQPLKVSEGRGCLVLLWFNVWKIPGSLDCELVLTTKLLKTMGGESKGSDPKI